MGFQDQWSYALLISNFDRFGCSLPQVVCQFYTPIKTYDRSYFSIAMPRECMVKLLEFWPTDRLEENAILVCFNLLLSHE
jgi:hypothetical protein